MEEGSNYMAEIIINGSKCITEIKLSKIALYKKKTGLLADWIFQLEKRLLKNCVCNMTLYRAQI